MSFGVMIGMWIYNQEFFRRTFTLLKQDVKMAQENDEELDVIVYCKSGRHRSVGFATFLAYILTCMGCAHTVTHECDWYWQFVTCQQRARRRNTQCATCFGLPLESKLMLLHAANELWHDL